MLFTSAVIFHRTPLTDDILLLICLCTLIVNCSTYYLTMDHDHIDAMHIPSLRNPITTFLFGDDIMYLLPSVGQLSAVHSVMPLGIETPHPSRDRIVPQHQTTYLGFSLRVAATSVFPDAVRGDGRIIVERRRGQDW